MGFKTFLISGIEKLLFNSKPLLSKYLEVFCSFSTLFSSISLTVLAAYADVFSLFNSFFKSSDKEESNPINVDKFICVRLGSSIVLPKVLADPLSGIPIM